MKNIFSNLLLVLAALAVFAACDNGETELRTEGTFPNVFDVRASENSNFLLLAPAFADTVYSLNKSDAAGLQAGDRVYMVMGYKFDHYAMSKPELSVNEVITKVPRLAMSEKGSFDESSFNSAFTITPLLTFSDEFCQMAFHDFLWADEETQNISVAFPQNYICEPRMTFEGYDNDSVLQFRLHANIAKRDWPDFDYYQYFDKKAKILSFNMDWEAIYNSLSDAQKSDIVKIDSLRGSISLLLNNEKGGSVLKTPYTNWFANKLYRRK